MSIFGTRTNTSGRKKTAYVGLSGGVDSAVSAALLKKAGYDVTGVFIKVWQPDSTDCGWKDERRDAMRVAAALDIPFETLDLSLQYKKEVADYMIEEYSRGRTPNPDVMCNRHVKFGSFLDEARRRGIDYVATGHYAQNIEKHGQRSLLQGKDADKDQSYFLWTLTQRDLSHILFPVGHLEKSEVRRLAEKLKLPVFDKKDSQGVCFIGHLDMKAFLKEYVKTEKGDVLDTDGNVIGEHDGALLYTVGERHGFRIFNTKTSSEPHFITGKDAARNILVAVPQSAMAFRLEELAPRRAKIEEASWVGGIPPLSGTRCEARIRYRQERQACTITLSGSGKAAEIEFDSPQKGMAEGQSVVFYDGEACLGGGILTS